MFLSHLLSLFTGSCISCHVIQYDIIMGARVDEKMAGEDEEEGEGLKSKRKSKKKEEPKIDWEVRMRDTKR